MKRLTVFQRIFLHHDTFNAGMYQVMVYDIPRNRFCLEVTRGGKKIIKWRCG